MSYRLKLTVTISLLIALSFGIGGTLMITTAFNTGLAKDRQAALESFASLQNTLGLLSSMDSKADTDTLCSVLTQMTSQNSDRWQAMSLSSEEENLFLYGSTALLDFPLPTPSSGQCCYLSVYDKYGHGLLVLSTVPAAENDLSLLVRFDLSDAYNIRSALLKQYFIIYFVVVFFGIVASFALSIALTARLHRLTATVRKIACGDLSKRSRLTVHDEFGQLSRTFDIMADKLQENICRLETEMEQQERFMGSFAHELKTPMTSIIGFADLLRQGDLDENTRLMAANYIHSEGHRLERLSFKLLDLLLLKKDDIHMKSLPLPSYISQVEQTLSPMLKQKNVRLFCKAESASVLLEPDLVKSLLYNLVDNAVKAIDSDGIIVLQAMAIPDGCQFQVTDNGRGMASSELSRITEAFYRVDKARSRSLGGAGLGLSLCEQIVRLHRGTMHFESVPGKGTRVTVKLYGKAENSDV